VNLVGRRCTSASPTEGMPGVVSRMQFDMWWNGGMRSAPYYHNMIGILTETAHPSPTPRHYDPDSIPEYVGGAAGRRAPHGVPEHLLPEPVPGGWVRFSDAVNYMLEASMATLTSGPTAARTGSTGSTGWARGLHRARHGGRSVRLRGPARPVGPGEAVELVNVLRRGGVEVHRATAAFQADGRRVPGRKLHRVRRRRRSARTWWT
jgi:hypothetical protein